MELKTYFLPLLRWWWLLLLASGLAAVTSFWTVRQQPDRYQSTTTLMIGQVIQDPNPSNAQLNLGNQLAEAYADIAERGPVRQATMAALGVNRLPSYNVQALPNRQLIQIAVVDTDPAQAQAVASELANQLIRLSPGGSQEGDQERQAFINQQLDTLEEQIAATEGEIQEEQEILGELVSAQEIADTQNEIAALQSKLSTLQSTYAGLLAGTKEEAVNTLSVIEPASFPRRPVGPGQGMTVLAATAIAFALAAGAAYLLEYLDDTIKSPQQVSKLFDLPVVGTIARLQSENGEGGLVMKHAPRSPEAEGFRGLRTTIQRVLAAGELNTLLITSPHQKEGKSLVSANLALAMAQAGQRTLLIDGDLHRPSQHKLFDLENKQGLSTLLEHMQSPLPEKTSPGALHESLRSKGIIKDTAQERLSVITSGSLSSHPSELLVSSNIRALLNLLAERYDAIILDTPPVLAVSDAAALSSQVGTVFVLASAKETRKSELQSVVDHLQAVDANIGGVILNQLSSSSEHYYYSYYRYSDYGREAGSEVKEDSILSAIGNGSNGLLSRIRGRRSQEGSPGHHSSASDS